MNNKEAGEKMRHDFPNTPTVGTVMTIGPQVHEGGWSIGWKGWTHTSKWGDYAVFDGEMPQEGDYLRGIIDAVRQIGVTTIRSRMRIEEIEDEEDVRKAAREDGKEDGQEGREDAPQGGIL